MPEDVKADALFFGGENRLFIRHIRELKGRNIEIGLISGTIIDARLIDVFTDFILVETYRGRYHVRLLTIEYVRV